MGGKRLILGAVALVCAPLLFAADAEARPRPQRMQSNFQANKTFGLGIMLGTPSGLSGKYYLSADTALDFGLGAYYGYRHHGGLHLHIDFLWHPVSLASTPQFELPLYVGLGGRIWGHDHDHDDDRHDHDSDVAVGVRVPVGIAMDFNRVPFDIFLELAMTVDVISDHDHVDLGGAIGARYYFQ